jgi:hypothetical protein
VVIVILQLVEQPLLSVTTTLYVPAASPLIVAVIAPLLQKYVYPPEPPDAVTVALPLDCPQVALLLEIEHVGVPEADTIAEQLVVQPWLSVIITEYVPALSPDIVALVAPVFHRYV